MNDKYFTPERLREFEPKIREVVKNLVADLPRGTEVNVMDGVRAGLCYAHPERVHGLACEP